MICVMNITKMYKKIIEKRLERKKRELQALESSSELTPIEKRKYIELKAIITEFESLIDFADSMFNEESAKK